MGVQFRLLTPAEINLLCWLAMAAGQGQPVTLGARHRAAVPGLWRMQLVDIWNRRHPFDQPQAIGLYFSLTLAGWQRAQPFLIYRRAAKAARSIPSSQQVQHDNAKLR